MSWEAFSEDGKRMIAVSGTGYNLYRAVGAGRYQWAGWVPEFRYAAQFRDDGDVCGEIIDVPNAPPAKVKRGTAA